MILHILLEAAIRKIGLSGQRRHGLAHARNGPVLHARITSQGAISGMGTKSSSSNECERPPRSAGAEGGGRGDGKPDWLRRGFVRRW
jgi:hypothetical protein